MKAFIIVFNTGVKWKVKGHTPAYVLAKYKLQRNTIKLLYPA